MLRVLPTSAARRPRPGNYLLNHFTGRRGWQQNLRLNRRSFFWSSSGDGGGGGKDNKDKEDGSDGKDGDAQDGDDNDTSQNDGDEKNENYQRGRKRTFTSGGNGGTSSAVVPSRLGFGDQSPRYPHLVGLPVITRPLFPGIVTTVTLTDPATIDAIENKSNEGGAGGYIGVFLRKKSPSGVSEGGVILEKPEVITDPSDLYKVGTFAQIHRLSRGVGGSSSGLHAHPGGLGGGNNGTIVVGEGEDKGDDDDDANKIATVLLLAHRRIDLLSVDEIGPPVDVTVSHWNRLEHNPNADSKVDDTLKALSNEILSTIRELAQLNPLFREHVQFFPSRVNTNDPYYLADFAASMTTGSPEELQAVLEAKDAEKRLHKSLVLLSKEREVSKLQQEISAKVEEKMSESQRKYFLTEQLKSIKKELGMERDDKDAIIEKYRKVLKDYPEIPTEVMETIDSELEKLSTLEKNSSEFNVTRSYLDWLTSVPWGVVSEENFDLRDARRILDRDHYGLDEVKDTILQFIAIGKLKGTVQGKILCLAGPPGTGKTSVAKSVASALGRKFYRFSVGGLSDVSEIKGHRRTYVGAMPGKIIQCLKSTGTNNPLILIDEIDKLGRDHRGDPASALLEVLDPSQNSTFRDHFLDVPVDASKVLFMCTANDIDRIPGPLLDRMEVIRLSGYDVPEKVAIADQYLVPKSMKESGLLVQKEKKGEEEAKGEEEGGEEKTGELVNDIDDTKKNEGVEVEDFEESFMDLYEPAKGVPQSLSIELSAIESLVRWYCREAGVRNLAKHIDKITRKLALQVVAEGEGTTLTEKSTRKSDTWVVTDKNLDEYVGKKLFTCDRMYEKDPLPHGIVMGLAWTSLGGSALYVETQGIKRGLDTEGKPRGGGTLKVTGQLGDVMKESTQIAYTVARSRLAEVQPGASYFDENDIHMHVPEGATPKDGPSAGITMVTAMLSLALDRPIKNDLAMTGELSLTGKVLPVGGIKEKTMAAKRAGIKCLIFPSANQRDFDEIPDYLKEGLDVYYADDYSTVYEVAFGDTKENKTA